MQILLVLHAKSESDLPCDASRIDFSTFSQLSCEEISRMPIIVGREWKSLADFFEISRVATEGVCDTELGCEVIVLRGNCSKMSHLANGFTSGTIIIDGDVGDSFATSQKGGTIVVLGSAGHHACRGMVDGLIVIGGNCGDGLAGPLPGKKSGMRGGDIVVHGGVGDRLAERLRRGTILIGGTAGDYGCAQLVAGTVVCLSTIGEQWCYGMKRGSLMIASEWRGESHARFSSPRGFELSFLPLIWRHLSKQQSLIQNMVIKHIGQDLSPITVPTTRWVERRVGDLDSGGHGEVLELTRLTDRSGT
jgi:formylmethanofuran dehydrogenase subunit C